MSIIVQDYGSLSGGAEIISSPLNSTGMWDKAEHTDVPSGNGTFIVPNLSKVFAIQWYNSTAGSNTQGCAFKMTDDMSTIHYQSSQAGNGYYVSDINDNEITFYANSASTIYYTAWGFA